MSVSENLKATVPLLTSPVEDVSAGVPGASLELLVAKVLAPAPLPKAITLSGREGGGRSPEGAQVHFSVSGPSLSRPAKSETAFRTIGEVAEDLGVPQHVLRFWETKFSAIRPLKRGGRRRYYRPEDVNLLKRIHHLLYSEGYTIRGAQKLLKSSGKAEKERVNAVAAPSVLGRSGRPSEEGEDSSISFVLPGSEVSGEENVESTSSGWGPEVEDNREDGDALPASAGSVGQEKKRPEKLTEYQRNGLRAILADLLEIREALSVV